MTSFRTFGEWKTIRELGLSSKAREISQEEAFSDADFDYPVELFHLWQQMPKTQGGKAPHFREMKPSNISKLILPSMFVMDVVDAGADFRWRLFGTDHAQRFGGEVTGRRMSTIGRFEPSAATSLEFAQLCFVSERPVFFQTDYIDNDITIKQTATVSLPLVGNSGAIERLFGCSVWI